MLDLPFRDGPNAFENQFPAMITCPCLIQNILQSLLSHLPVTAAKLHKKGLMARNALSVTSKNGT